MKKRITGMLLAILIVFNLIGFNVAKAEELGTEKQHLVIENQEYDVAKTVTNGTKKIVVTSPSLEDTLTYVITDKCVTLTYKGQSYTSKIAREEKLLSTINYGHTVRSKVDDRYYYKYGSQGVLDYVQIGCIEDYQIRTDILSEDRKAKVSEYTDGIIDSNDYYNTAIGHIGAEYVAVLVTALVAGILAPGALLIAVVAAGFTGTLSQVILAVNALNKASGKMKEAADVYDVIKSYGFRL